MTIYLSETDEDEFCRVTRLNDNEELFELSAWYGQIRDRWISLRHGIEVTIWDSEFSEPVISEGTHDDFAYLGSKFYLSGGMRTVTPNVPGVDDDYEEVAGHNYLFYLPNTREFEHSAANQRTKEVRIC